MSDKPKWLEWAHQMQTIAQAGLAYGKDVYDLDRYTQLQSLAAEIVASHTSISAQRMDEILGLESGYPTPKVDVRAVVFNSEGKLLFVRETTDGCWSLPGGWADIGDSAGEAVVREVYEESGYEVKALRLLALFDWQKHAPTPMYWQVYKVFIECELIGGQQQTSIETDSIEFFHRDHLPELSTTRITKGQVMRMFEHFDDPELPPDFD